MVMDLVMNKHCYKQCYKHWYQHCYRHCYKHLQYIVIFIVIHNIDSLLIRNSNFLGINMRSIPLSLSGTVALTLCLVLTVSASKPSEADYHLNRAKVFEDEYNHLHANTEDKDGLESIRFDA